ncbi:MAG: ROK family protein [Candidatus Solibacter usitatus]|nr:ROK family protein [Candidatus Solibacter usitatus]
MQGIVGVLAADHVAAALVVENRVSGLIRLYPEPGAEGEAMASLHAEDIIDLIAREVAQLTKGQPVDTIGVGFPGIIRDGVVEESPNLQQTKGCRLQERLAAALNARVLVLNDADATAAGIAATQDRLETLVRVWTLGVGIGYGRYPRSQGVWEGGHMVVSLDPKERYCGCGGIGHLEGVMGQAAMRRRFLDLEPDEVFTAAQAGDPRCAAFVKLWHRSLAAATANSIHLDGPGKFFISGLSARFVDVPLLSQYLQEMVKMSSLQGSLFEVITTSDETAIVGAAINAGRARTAA